MIILETIIDNPAQPLWHFGVIPVSPSHPRRGGNHPRVVYECSGTEIEKRTPPTYQNVAQSRNAAAVSIF